MTRGSGSGSGSGSGRERTPYALWARTYFDLGWSPVPMPAKEKWPPADRRPGETGPDAKQSYTGGNGKFVDLREVQLWSTGMRAAAGNLVFPATNIALRLPKNVIGIDVDTYGDKKGAQALERAVELWGPLPATWMSCNRVATPLSGIRLFRLRDADVAADLAWPESLRVTEIAIGGVELIRWDHRYVVGAPSLHDEGRTYFWRDPDGNVVDLAALALGVAGGGDGAEEVELELPSVDELPELPPSWVEGLTNGRTRAEGRAGGALGDGAELTEDETREWLAGRTEVLGEEICAVMDRTLTNYLRSVRAAGDDGGAHDVARDGAWALIGDAAGGHAGVEKALSGLRAAFLEAVKARRGNRVAADEWKRIVIRGVSKVNAEFGDELESGDRCINRYATTRAAEAARGEGGRKVRRSAGAFEYTRDDRGNAHRLYNAFDKGQNVLYCKALGGYLLWDAVSGRWVLDEDALQVTATFCDLVDDMIIEAQEAGEQLGAEAAKALEKFARASGNIGKISSAVQLLRTLPGVAVSAASFDSAPDVFLCANGTVLELTPEGVTVRPAARGDRLTLSTGVPYVPGAHRVVSADGSGVDAGAALWERFLGDAVPEPAVRHWLQKAVGYSMLGANPERYLFVIRGKTSSGKSTFAEAIASVFGEYASTFNFSLFRAEREQGPNVPLVTALPKRYIYASEASPNVSLHADEIKRATGGETMGGRLNNANVMVERVPAFTPWIVTNYPPHVAGADQALFRRVVSIPFDQTIAKDDEDVRLGERLKRSSSLAILSWMVEGWELYAREGLWPLPETLAKHTALMARDLNDFLLWLGERTERVDDEIVTATTDLYQDYEIWCDTNNLKVESKVAFGRSLARNGFETGFGGSKLARFRGWRGIRLANG